MLKPTYQSDIYHSNFPKHGSRLVYGTSGLGGVWGSVDEQESIDCLLFAFENGISSIDTAPSYNRAEEFVGKALRRWKGTRPFISTKVGRLKCEDPFDMILDYSPKGMKDSVYRSLDLLGVNRIDLLFLHEPHLVPLDKIDEILDSLKLLQQEGVVGMLGVGGNPPKSFLPFIKKENFEVVSGYCRMDSCNLSVFEQEMPLYLRNKIHYYAASSLHFALLGNRYLEYTAQLPQGELGNYITARDVEMAKAVRVIAERMGLNLSSMAQRYLFSISEATRIVMGARNIQQIKHTITDWKEGALERSLFEEITAVLISTGSVFQDKFLKIA